MITPAFALSPTATDDQIISFEEYFDAVHAEFAKYGIDYQVLEKNDDFVFTQKILDDRLTEIREAMSQTSVSNNTDCDFNAATTVTTITPRTSTSGSSSTNAARIMPVEQVYQYQQYLECPVAPGLAWAYICIEVVALVDAQGGNLMSIEDYSSFQKGFYLNFVNWEQRSMEVEPDYMTGSFTATVNGKLTVEYTEPHSGLLVGHTSEHTFSHTFSIYD